VAAGSVVTEDVPDDCLVIARARQVVKPLALKAKMKPSLTFRVARFFAQPLEFNQELLSILNNGFESVAQVHHCGRRRTR